MLSTTNVQVDWHPILLCLLTHKPAWDTDRALRRPPTTHTLGSGGDLTLVLSKAPETVVYDRGNMAARLGWRHEETRRHPPTGVVRIYVSQVIPAAASPLRHGGGLSSRRPALRVRCCHPLAALGQRRVGCAAGFEVLGGRKHQWQFRLTDCHRLLRARKGWQHGQELARPGEDAAGCVFASKPGTGYSSHCSR